MLGYKNHDQLNVRIVNSLKAKLQVALQFIDTRLGQIGNNTSLSNQLLVELIYQERLKQHKNTFARCFAKKHFSQTDEDGITLEIINRIRSVDNGYGKTFAEFGVGDGCENNTLVLLSHGWRGSWFGGEDLAFSADNSLSLRFNKVWITKSSIVDCYQIALNNWSIKQLDLISLDLDGNDYHLIESLLNEGANPALFICEYNAIFPVGTDWKISYQDDFRWNGDHYFGASLTAYVELFSRHDYFLCACNPHTGANAFFVQSKYRHLFPDVPSSIEDIYVSPFYRLDNQFTHAITPTFIRSLFD